MLPITEIYLHKLLCYMYWGPPGSPNLETCHECEKKMCLAPWHLVWGTHQDNMQGHATHKANKRQFHPYPRPNQ